MLRPMMYIGRWAMTPPVTSSTPSQNAPAWPKVTPPNALVRAAVGLDNSMRFLTRAGDRLCLKETGRSERPTDPDSGERPVPVGRLREPRTCSLRRLHRDGL